MVMQAGLVSAATLLGWHCCDGGDMCYERWLAGVDDVSRDGAVVARLELLIGCDVFFFGCDMCA